MIWVPINVCYIQIRLQAAIGCFRKMVRRIAKEWGGKYYANNGQYQMTLALNGHGIVILPDFIACDAVRNGGLVLVLADYDMAKADIQVVYAEKKNMRGAARIY